MNTKTGLIKTKYKACWLGIRTIHTVCPHVDGQGGPFQLLSLL